jgi:hypothetical protein
MPQQQQQVKSTKAYKTNFVIFCYTSGKVRNFKEMKSNRIAKKMNTFERTAVIS